MNRFLFAFAFASLSSAINAMVVFSDTFDYTGTPTFETDLTTNITARQAAGPTTSTYTKQTAGPAGNASGLNVSNGNDMLLLRTLNAATGASQSAVDLDQNFASQLAGKSYTITLTDMFQARSSATITDSWYSISIGDTATSISGPNSAQADAAILIRPRATNNLTRWADGAAAGTTTTGLNQNFGFTNRLVIAELRIDEGAGTAAAFFEDINGATYLSPSWSVDFDNSTDRFIELRAHQSATGTDGQLMDARADSLTITVIPEPSATTLLAGFLVFTFMVRRRS